MKCKKSLYKSPYRGLAFSKNKIYGIFSEDDDFVWFLDNQNQQFSFAKKKIAGFYMVNEYFDKL